MKKMFPGAAVLLLFLILNLQLTSAHAQGTAFTYQGRVTDNGTNFTGAGQFKFALVTSTNTSSQARATANAPSGGYITGYNLISAGNGYGGSTVAMTITGGGGSGAAAHANISGGMVTSITIENPGNGLYTSAPTVTIDPPPANILYTTYWSNDGTSANGSEPTTAANVTVNSGLFTVTLGDTNVVNMAAIEASLFTQPNLQLRIWFSDGVNGFAALDPAQNLTPAPYAVNAMSANTAIGLNGLSIQQNSDGAPNMILGSPGNFVPNGVEGATIGGGGTMNYFGYRYTNSVTGNFGTVSGGINNTASSYSTTVGGGDDNIASGYQSTVGGGEVNTASGNTATVSGGYDNVASGDFSVVAGGGGYYGGDGNKATNSYSTVSGGYDNLTGGYAAIVGGGYDNTASGPDAMVGGGYYNQATNHSATVPGGYENVAGGQYSFAAGQQAQALHQGAFVWADSQNSTFSSTANNQFLVRADGGVGINTASPQQALSVNGGMNIDQAGINDGYVQTNGLTFGNVSGEGISSVRVSGPADAFGLDFYTSYDKRMTIRQNGNVGIGTTNPAALFVVGSSLSPAYCNGTTWVNGSDRNAKEDFSAINPQKVLEKISAMPITEWKYKVEADGTEHIGPMAQDFHAAFGLNGGDDKHISTVDEGGVALAAIQGLNEKMQETDAENAKLKQQNELLTQRLNELEAAVKQLAAQK